MKTRIIATFFLMALGTQAMAAEWHEVKSAVGLFSASFPCVATIETLKPTPKFTRRTYACNTGTDYRIEEFANTALGKENMLKLTGDAAMDALQKDVVDAWAKHGVKLVDSKRSKEGTYTVERLVGSGTFKTKAVIYQNPDLLLQLTVVSTSEAEAPNVEKALSSMKLLK